MSRHLACLFAVLPITITLLACSGQTPPGGVNAGAPTNLVVANAGQVAPPLPTSADKPTPEAAVTYPQNDKPAPPANTVGDSPPTTGKPSAEDAGEKPEAVTDAGELCAAFCSDEAKARRTFLKHRLRVAGRVVDSGNSLDTGSPFLVLAKAPDDFNTVRCSLKPGQNANGYRRGDTVTMIGTCGDYTVMTPSDLSARTTGLPDKWAVVWLDGCEPATDGKRTEATSPKPEPPAEAHKREEAKKAAEEKARHEGEDEAARKVKLAKRLFADADDAHFARRAEDEQRLRQEGNAVLREVVEKYPATKGATEAKKLLGDE
jgi:hypothetical protein